jgi:hypothetical protein
VARGRDTEDRSSVPRVRVSPRWGERSRGRGRCTLDISRVGRCLGCHQPGVTRGSHGGAAAAAADR